MYNAAINLCHFKQVNEQFPVSFKFNSLKISSKTSGGKFSIVTTAISSASKKRLFCHSGQGNKNLTRSLPSGRYVFGLFLLCGGLSLFISLQLLFSFTDFLIWNCNKYWRFDKFRVSRVSYLGVTENYVPSPQCGKLKNLLSTEKHFVKSTH